MSLLNEYPSKTLLFKHFGRYVCMKWYPSAHLAAVTIQSFKDCSCCFRTPLVAFLLYIFKFPYWRCRPLLSPSDNLSPFQRRRGGKHKLCTYGAGMAKSRWAGTPSYAKTTDLSGSIFSSPGPESHRKTDTLFITPAAAGENI